MSSDVVHVLLVVGIVVYVIGRQLTGEALQGKRVVVLPAVLAVIGVVDLAHASARPGPLDLVLLAAGGLAALAVGLGQGAMMRLESRGGHLWGQMPPRALWLWAALLGSRLLLTLVAHAGHAHVAGSADTVLLMLGMNRLAQALVVVLRAWSMGVPFAPEKDGSSFLGRFLAGDAAVRGGTARPAPTPVPTVRPGAAARRPAARRPSRRG